VPSFKILVVDDYEDFRRFVRSVLQQNGEFQVAEASDGWEAIRRPSSCGRISFLTNK